MADFYTLHSNQPQGMENEFGVTYDPSSSRLVTPPATHDTSGSSSHIEDISKFVEILEQSAKRAFPNTERRQSRYRNVEVLMLRWEQDHLNVEPELEGLLVVFRRYGFRVTRWHIPSGNAHRKLMMRVGEFVESNDQKDCLMIIYYGGHAFINEARQSTWAWCVNLKLSPPCARVPGSGLFSSRSSTHSTLDWSAIQTLFEAATSDVLILLDCCAAASSASAPKSDKGMTETIAACGWEGIAPEPGRFSFTSALIEVLEEWINRRFSVAMLHSQILSVLKHERPELLGGDRRVECRTTPIYIATTKDPEMPSIILNQMSVNPQQTSPGRSKKRAREDDIEASTARDKTSRKRKRFVSKDVGPSLLGSEQLGSYDEMMDHLQDTSVVLVDSDDIVQSNDSTQLLSPPTDYSANGDTLQSSDGDGMLRIPHVLISVALETDQKLDADACCEWLASFPALAQYVKVQSIYRSYSTLLIISIPVVIWDVLPDHPAYRFIAFVRSDDVLSGKSKAGLKKALDISRQIKQVAGVAHAGTALAKIPNPSDGLRINSRSPSISRSVNLRRSMSPVSGNALRFPRESPSFSQLGQHSGSSSLQDFMHPPMNPAPLIPPPAKKSRTNTPWTPAEEQRLKTMRDAGNSWATIAKTFPSRAEGSIKKHWYKDMHYAEFAEDESQTLLNAIKEYETNKWKEIGKKVGKPAKACEQYGKEHFGGKI